MSLNKFNKTVGYKLKLARKNAGFTQEKAAELLNVDNNKISRIEQGKQAAEFEDIFNLARLYNKSIYYFLEDFKKK